MNRSALKAFIRLTLVYSLLLSMPWFAFNDSIGDLAHRLNLIPENQEVLFTNALTVAIETLGVLTVPIWTTLLTAFLVGGIVAAIFFIRRLLQMERRLRSINEYRGITGTLGEVPTLDYEKLVVQKPTTYLDQITALTRPVWGKPLSECRFKPISRHPYPPPLKATQVNPETPLGVIQAMDVRYQQIIQSLIDTLGRYPSVFVGSGHQTTLLQHSIAVAIEAWRQDQAHHDDREPLVFIAALAHDLGKIVSFDGDKRRKGILGRHDVQGARLLAAMNAYQELPDIDKKLLSAAIYYGHTPEKAPLFPDPAGKRFKRIMDAIQLADHGQTQIEQKDIEKELEDPKKAEALLKQPVILTFGQLAWRAPGTPGGKKSDAFRQGKRIYLLEIPFRKNLIRNLPPDVAVAIGSNQRKPPNSTPILTKKLLPFLEQWGWLVRENEAGFQSEVSNAVWVGMSGAQEFKGIIALEPDPNIISDYPETDYPITLMRPLYGAPGSGVKNRRERARKSKQRETLVKKAAELHRQAMEKEKERRKSESTEYQKKQRNLERKKAKLDAQYNSLNDKEKALYEQWLSTLPEGQTLSFVDKFAAIDKLQNNPDQFTSEIASRNLAGNPARTDKPRNRNSDTNRKKRKTPKEDTALTIALQALDEDQQSAYEKEVKRILRALPPGKTLSTSERVKIIKKITSSQT